MTHPAVLSASDSVLLVVDVQDAFLKAIWERERVIENAVKLVEAAKVFEAPVLVTLQNAQRLGGCSQAVADALPQGDCIDKMTFSCLGDDTFRRLIEDTGRRQVLICGVETHICVNQTAHDLLSLGFTVHIARDAVSSRTQANWEVGIEKMRGSGCVITSTEAAIFELLGDASKPEFKQILPLVK